MAMMETEELWSGEFGDNYTYRNLGRSRANVDFFQRALRKAGDIHTVLELGANIGRNLRALKACLPDCTTSGVEINKVAFEFLKKEADYAYHGSIFEERPWRYDLVFTRGVLIHVLPELLPQIYQRIFEASNRWILLAEYFATTPTMVRYRGKDNVMWRGDFCDQMMKQYEWKLSLRDYGFIYHRDPIPQDSITWFLLEKVNVNDQSK